MKQLFLGLLLSLAAFVSNAAVSCSVTENSTADVSITFPASAGYGYQAMSVLVTCTGHTSTVNFSVWPNSTFASGYQSWPMYQLGTFVGTKYFYVNSSTSPGSVVSTASNNPVTGSIPVGQTTATVTVYVFTSGSSAGTVTALGNFNGSPAWGTLGANDVGGTNVKIVKVTFSGGATGTLTPTGHTMHIRAYANCTFTTNGNLNFGTHNSPTGAYDTWTASTTMGVTCDSAGIPYTLGADNNNGIWTVNGGQDAILANSGGGCSSLCVTLHLTITPPAGSGNTTGLWSYASTYPGCCGGVATNPLGNVEDLYTIHGTVTVKQGYTGTFNATLRPLLTF